MLRWRYKDMKHIVGKILAGVAVAVSGILPAVAETVSQKQASKIAETFFNAAYGQFMSKPKLIWNGRQLTTDRLFSPFYIYNHPKGGFVIISADSKAFPVIGYSRTNSFSRDRLSDDENELLRQYAREVEMIRYDSRTPSRAIDAWTHLPAYIDNVLNNPYNTPEYRALTDEQKEHLETIDRRNGWIMLPSAVEFDIYNPELYRDYTLDDVTAEDVPFSFFEEFLREIREEELTRAAALDEILSPTRPVVKMLGGAHFEIYIPENVRMMRVYDLNGSKKIEKYLTDSNTVNVDLSSMPPGFYVAMILGEDGKVYGLKLYR